MLTVSINCNLKGPRSPLSPLKARGEKQAGNTHFTDIPGTRELSNMLWVCIISHVGIIAILPGVSVGAGRHRPSDKNNWNNAYRSLWVISLYLFTFQTGWFWNHDIFKAVSESISSSSIFFCLVLNLEAIVPNTQHIKKSGLWFQGPENNSGEEMVQWMEAQVGGSVSICQNPCQEWQAMGSHQYSYHQWSGHRRISMAYWSTSPPIQQVPGSAKDPAQKLSWKG